MNNEQSSTVPQCQTHNKPALLVNTNNIQTIIQQEFPCEKCFGEYIFTNSNSQNNDRNENLQNSIKINTKKLKVFEQMLIDYKNNLSKEINSIHNFIQEQQKKLESLQLQVFQNKEEFQKSENDVEMILKNLSNKLNQLSLALNINNFEIILKLKLIQNQSDNLKIIPLTSTDHDKQCQAIAFSYDSQIMIAGDQNSIKVFEFKDQKLNKIQLLDEHKKNVSYLQFMKSNKQFISCSMDGQIIIWTLHSNQNKWIVNQIINDSQYSITCIKFNKQQNMFVSSGVDCQVKFYEKSSKNFWQEFDKISFSSYVVDLSFNKDFSKLFVGEYNNIVSILHQAINSQQWLLNQKIKINFKILQIQSIHDDLALLSQNDHKIHILSKKEEAFMEIQQFNLQCENLKDTSYHMRLKNNNQYEYLLVCGGSQIHIFLINVEKKLDLVFTYKSPAILSYARVSEDRKYLSYWEKQSNKIHIMSFEKH